MGKFMQPISVIFLGICIVLGAWIISKPTESSQALDLETIANSEQNRYEFITVASDYFIIFDKHTGQYWRQIGGTPEWEKQKSIISPSE